LKQKTNEDLLFNVIETNMGDDEFFIRKAIGWALREYAKTNSESVIKFVNRNKDSLSPLSKKEGLRILAKDGVITSIP
jgi:3-methyladenine DNA glycosylase AlkD